MGNFTNIIAILRAFNEWNPNDLELKLFENFEEITKYSLFYTLPFNLIYETSKYYYSNLRYKESIQTNYQNQQTFYDRNVINKIRNCSKQDQNLYEHELVFKSTKKLIKGVYLTQINQDISKLLNIIYIPHLTLEESSKIIEIYSRFREFPILSTLYSNILDNSSLLIDSNKTFPEHFNFINYYSDIDSSNSNSINYELLSYQDNFKKKINEFLQQFY